MELEKVCVGAAEDWVPATGRGRPPLQSSPPRTQLRGAEGPEGAAGSVCQVHSDQLLGGSHEFYCSSPNSRLAGGQRCCREGLAAQWPRQLHELRKISTLFERK